jgi:magnesium transporter
MLQFYVKKSFSEDPQPVKDAPADHGWAYGSEVTSHELDEIAEKYQLNRGILEDVLDHHELPRAEHTDGALYIFIRSARIINGGNVKTTPFLAVLKGTMLITLCSQKYLIPKELFSQANIDMRSAKHLFLQIVGSVIREYSELVHESGNYVRSAERRLQVHEVTNKDFIKFVTVEGDLNEYKTNLSAIQVVLNRLHENRHNTFVDNDCEYIEDMALLVNQLLVSSDSHMQIIGSIRNAYTTISNNILNQRMKTLTLLTLLVALPNVFYGMFGMNVPLPFQGQPWAYAAITGFTLMLVILAYVIVRRMRF